MLSNSPRLAALENDCQELAGYRRTRPCGSFESRTKTLSATEATSTQAPLLMLSCAFRQFRSDNSCPRKDISDSFTIVTFDRDSRFLGNANAIV